LKQIPKEPCMSDIFRAVLAGIALSALALPALAEEAGSVVSVTGDAGSVIVVRGTETLSLSPDDILFEGDRIITQTSGATEVTAYGCTRSLASLESLIIAADFCTQTIASVAADGTVLADAAIVQGSGVGAALPIAGVAAAAAAAAAAGGGDGASSP
jgi:hypothetical protein